jgi:hypothetical protein
MEMSNIDITGRKEITQILEWKSTTALQLFS